MRGVKCNILYIIIFQQCLYLLMSSDLNEIVHDSAALSAAISKHESESFKLFNICSYRQHVTGMAFFALDNSLYYNL